MGCDMVVSRYAIPTGIPRVDGLSTEPPGFEVSHLQWAFPEGSPSYVWPDW